RQEPEPLPGLDRRPGEDQPRDLPLLESPDRDRDGQVRLARSGRSDREGHGGVADRIDVALLSEGLRGDLLAARGQQVVPEHLARSRKLLLAGFDDAPGDHRDRLPDRILREVVAPLEELQELLEDATHTLGLVGVPRDRDLVAPDGEVWAEGAFDELEEGIALAEEG